MPLLQSTKFVQNNSENVVFLLFLPITPRLFEEFLPRDIRTSGQQYVDRDNKGLYAGALGFDVPFHDHGSLL